MRQFIFFLSLLAFLSACKKDEPYYAPQSVPGHIRFDTLAVGQVSRYLCLNGRHYYTISFDGYFEYTDDTLQLEIVAQDANGFKVAETLHYAGAVNTWIDGPWMDSTYYYYLRVSNDTLRIIPVNTNYAYSRIFAFHARHDGIPLQKKESVEVKIKDWRTTFPSYADRFEGHVENYTQFGKTYDYLNVIVENSGMAADGNGETYIFSKPFGIVRFSTYGSWTGEGYGWDLLP